MSDVTLHLGDCLEYMRTLESGSVDLTVTSPPYDNLRDYGKHTWDFEGIARELYRVTKQGGVVVWVVGDATINGSETGTSFRQALYFMDCGFRLHDTMIYKKQSPAYPASDASVRYGQVFEYTFVFSKGKPENVALLKDRKNRWAGVSTFAATSRRHKNGELQVGSQYVIQQNGYRENIWQYHAGANFGHSEDTCVYEHPATFPEALARDHILSWSNEGDIVLDCMMGSGTTGKMAVKLNRNFIGCEIHEPYFRIAEKRIKEAQMQIRLPLDMEHAP